MSIQPRLLHRLSNLTLPIPRPLESIRKTLVIHQCLTDLRRISQHKRPVLHNRLVQRHTRHQNKPSLLLALRHRRLNIVALLLEDRVVELRDLLRLGASVPGDFAAERVRESVPACGQGLRDASAGSHCDVEKPDGRVGEFLQAVDAMRLAGDHFDGDFAVGAVVDGDFGAAHVAVARLAGLQVAGEVYPKLHANVA